MSVSVTPLTMRSRLSLRSPALLGMTDQVLVSGMSFLATLLLGRFTTPQELGRYTLGFTLLVLLTCTFESLLTIPYSVHRNRQEHPNQLAGSMLVLQALLTLVGILFLLGVAGCFALSGPPEMAVVIAALAGTAPFVLIREMARRYAFADHEPAVALAVDLGTATLQISLLAILMGLGQLSALTAHLSLGIACCVVGLSWLALLQRRFVVIPGRIQSDAWQAWIFGRWIVASQALGVINGYLIHWLLLFLNGDEPTSGEVGSATGTFVACLNILLLANPFVLGMAHILGPKAALAHSKSGLAGVRSVVRQGFILYAMVMGVFCGSVILLAGPLLNLFYADRFSGAEPIIRMLSLGVFCGALGMAMDPGLRALERTDLAFRASLLALVTTSVVGLCLIPLFGVLGGAIAYSIGSLAGSLTRGVLLISLLKEPAA